MAKSYDAFISYSHAADARLAAALEAGLERLARPWNRLRAMSVFRDENDLTLNPDLWGMISSRLDRSQYLVLLLCPESAKSPWVNKEAGHWCDSRGADHVLLVWTGGELAWDDAGGDFGADSSAVPATLRGRFAHEPLYLDARWARDEHELSLAVHRFKAAVAQVAAPIRGMSPGDLEDEDIRLRRRARRLGRTAIAAVVALAIVASAAAVVAIRNAHTADRRAREAVARQVGLAALDLPASEIDRAMLMALASAGLAPGGDDADRFGPAEVLVGRYSRLERLLHVGDDAQYVNVRGLAFADGGDTVVATAGRADGSSALATWRGPSPTAEITAVPDVSGTELVTTAGGDVVIVGGDGVANVDGGGSVAPTTGTIDSLDRASGLAWIAGADDQLTLVSTVDGSVRMSLPAGADALTDALTAVGSTRAAALVDGDLVTYDSVSGAIQATGSDAPSGALIAVGASDDAAVVEVTDAETMVRWARVGARLTASVPIALPASIGRATWLVVAPDGRSALLVAAGGTALVDLVGGGVDESPGGGATLVAVDPSGRFAAVGGSRLSVWDLDRGERVIAAPQATTALAWSGPCDRTPACKLVAAGIALDVIDPLGETQVRLVDEIGALTVAISSDGDTVLSGGWGPTVAVWRVKPSVDDSARVALDSSDVAALAPIAGAASTAGGPCEAGLTAVSPDGAYAVAVEPASAATRLCSTGAAASQQAVARLDPDSGSVTAVAVGNDGRVALGRSSGTVATYAVRDGQFQRGSAIDVRLGGEDIAVSTLATRGDVVVAGVRSVGASSPARVVIWPLGALAPTSFATDFTDVAAVAVLDDGARAIVVAGRDSDDGPVTIQLWETASRRRVGRALSGLEGDVTALVGSDTSVAGADAEGHAFRWDLDPDPTRDICAIVGRPLTEEEWDQFAEGALGRYGFDDPCPG